MKRVRDNSSAAFTLVELLVVIGIISLLVSILVPTLGRVKQQAQDAKVRSWARDLGNGCIAFKTSTNYYPGQKDPQQLLGGDANGVVANPAYTGTQVMAACLFSYKYTDINTFPLPIGAGLTADPSKAYCPFKNSDLINTAGGASVASNTVSDRWPDARPVLYYPWRLSATDLNQCKLADNATYLSGKDKVDNSIITDPKFGNKPYGNGGFMILAAGPDRIFGTADDIRVVP